MYIVFNMPHVFAGDSDSQANAYALRILLECLIGLNRAFLRSHSVPTLYRSGVRYGRTLDWLTIPALYSKQVGDCKSLTAALIAEYRNKGVSAEPVFRWIANDRGTGNNYHILVQTNKGFEDPSKVLGMGANALY